MLEKEIQFITDFNLNKIKTLGQTFTLNRLFEADLHPALIRYISGKLDHLIYEDRKVLIEKSAFDYSGPRIAKYFNLIAEEIKKTKKLTYNEVRSYIEKGIVFNANFCVQPKSTLINLIYKNTNEGIAAGEIVVYLNYIYYYDYIRDILTSYITKKNIINLNKAEFVSVLEKIDRELLLTRKDEIISDAFNSIADFYNDGGVSKTYVHIPLAEAYLEEKNLNELVVKLQKEVTEIKRKTEIDDLLLILFRGDIVKQAAEKCAEKAESGTESRKREEPAKNSLSDFEFKEEKRDDNLKRIHPEALTGQTFAEKTGGVVNRREDDDKNKITEIFKKESDVNKEIVSRETAGKETENKEIMRKETSNEDILNKETVREEKKNIQIIAEEKNKTRSDDIIFEEENDEKSGDDIIIEEEIIEKEIVEDINEFPEHIEEVLPEISGKERDLFSFLNEKEIDRIISSIFNEDNDDFANTMEKISECLNYDQASEILKSVFFTYRINPYSREAVILTNAVSNYFHQDN